MFMTVITPWLSRKLLRYGVIVLMSGLLYYKQFSGGFCKIKYYIKVPVLALLKMKCDRDLF